MIESTDSTCPEDGEVEYVMPCAEALMAGTLALMTGHARCGCAQHRDMMARKAAVNLHSLSQHPHISDALRSVAQKLYEQWVEVIQADLMRSMGVAVQVAVPTPNQDASSRTEQDKALHHRANWHTTPETIQ